MKTHFKKYTEMIRYRNSLAPALHYSNRNAVQKNVMHHEQYLLSLSINTALTFTVCVFSNT